MFLNDVKHFYVCFTRSAVLFIWMNKQKSNIHSSYVHIYNARLPLLTDINCEHVFRLKLAIMKSVSDIFLVPNMTHLKYQVHLITSCESVCRVYTSWLFLLPNSVIICFTKVCIHSIIPLMLWETNITCNCF